MAHQMIIQAKQIQKKSRGHRVRQVGPNWFKVFGGESSNRVISAVDIVQTALAEGDPGEVEFAGEILKGFDDLA